MRVLLLGGTTEAGRLAQALADQGVAGIYSYAGRTAQPVDQPLPVRIGGFGRVEGLVAFLREAGISHVIDATHPFAGQMSAHAVQACDEADVPLLALERAPWSPGPDDRWTFVESTEAAVAALPDTPACVFLAIGRQTLAAFARKPQHRYLLRLVDAPDAPLPLPETEVVIARGPFDVESDMALMQAQGVQIVVAKNAGGQGAAAKLAAARELNLPVIMVDRPAVPQRDSVETVAEAIDWLHQSDRRGV